MQIDNIRRRALARAGVIAMLAGLIAGCAEQSEPAPVFQRSAFEPAVAPMAPLQVVVRRGQTLDGFAYTYHVPKSAIIAANGLRPPYELKAGTRLTIPNARGAVRQAAIAPPPRPAPPPVPAQQAAIPQPPPTPQAIALPSAGRPPQTIFPAPEAATASRPSSPPPSVTPPPSAAKVMPEIIPLDGPPPREAAAPPRPPQATLTPPQAPPAQPTAPAAVAETAPAGRFPWPVRGRILASYGSAAGGVHNDGINIAAPLGTPVRSIDSGTVAYAGNEVKGYGNIVLIRHANGWISAYAHLDDVTVKPGDTIAAGQVIAKVGNSGGVAQPQLHFELRRGKKPVNPTEFLAPAPSAAAPTGNTAG